MTKIFNKVTVKQQRRRLRSEAPKAERLLWARLRSRQVEGVRFRRQFSIGTYVVNFYAPSIKLAIEVDGDTHFGFGAEARDVVRQSYIESFEIQFLRCTNDDVFDNLPGVLDEIIRVVRIRMADLPLSKWRKFATRGNPPSFPLAKGGNRGVNQVASGINDCDASANREVRGPERRLYS